MEAVHKGTRFKHNWRPQEVEYLLEATSHRHIRVFLPNHPDPVHTTLIGFDLSSSELLVEGFKPCSQYEAALLVGGSCPIHLQMAKGESHYFVKTLVSDIQPSPGSYLVTLRVLDSWSSPNKRLLPRIVFAPQQQPKVRVSPPWKPQMLASLCDISPQGCQLIIQGADVREKFSNRYADLNIEFNEHFCLRTRARLRQCVFKRQPYCHNNLQFLLTHLNPLQTEQLKALIDTSAMLNCDSPAIAM